MNYSVYRLPEVRKNAAISHTKGSTLVCNFPFLVPMDRIQHAALKEPVHFWDPILRSFYNMKQIISLKAVAMEYVASDCPVRNVASLWQFFC